MEQVALDRSRRAEERQEEARVLAAALFGELSALYQSLNNVEHFMRMQRIIWEHAAEDTRHVEDRIAPLPQLPTFRVAVYEANIAQLGKLGASIAGDVASVYSRFTVEKAPDTEARITSSQAAIIFKHLGELMFEWSWDILQLRRRLLFLQGLGDDPGSLGDTEAVARFRGKAAAPQGATA